MLKKILSDKIKGTKNALFFLSRTPTHHSFIKVYIFVHELIDFKTSYFLLKLTVLLPDV